jgi:dTDP-4-dehydrorhamnose 3,5-epimerase
MPLKGAYWISTEAHRDARGYFSEIWNKTEFEKHGIKEEFTRTAVSYNEGEGTLRGLHFQLPPHEEGKLVRVARGKIYDVIIDLRPGSPTRFEWISNLMTAEREMIFVPPGFAHGFITLADQTEVNYMLAGYFAPGKSDGIRWDDKAFGIKWPSDPKIISDQDRSYPDFKK